MMAVVGIWHKTRSTTKERGAQNKNGQRSAASTWVIVPRGLFQRSAKSSARGCTLRTNAAADCLLSYLRSSWTAILKDKWPRRASSIIYLFIYASSARYSLLFLYCSSFGEQSGFSHRRFIHEFWRRKACNNCNADNFLSQISSVLVIYGSMQKL